MSLFGTNPLEIGAYPLIMVVMMAIYTMVHDRITAYNDLKHLREGDLTPSINRVGAYIGIGLAMLGSIVMSKMPFEDNVKMFAVDGIFAIVVFVVAHFLIDWVVLRGINNAQEVGRGNRAVAIQEACTYIGLGFIIGAAFSGDGDGSFWSGMGNAAAFSGIGLVTLVGIYVMYDVMWRLSCKFWIDKEVGRGNEAAALDAGSLMLGMGLVLFFAIAGDHQDSLQGDIELYVKDSLTAVVVLVAVRLAVALLLRFLCKVGGCERPAARGLEGTHHGNTARSLVTAGVTSVTALTTGMAMFFA